MRRHVLPTHIVAQSGIVLEQHCVKHLSLHEIGPSRMTLTLQNCNCEM